jgi:hypothetical protein
VGALLGKAAAIENQDGLGLTQPAADQLLQARALRARGPVALANELLQSAHRVFIWPFEGQHHRLNRLALQISQLAAQVKGRPVPLLPPWPHICPQAQEGYQFVRTHVDILLAQSLPGGLPARWRLRRLPPRLIVSLPFHGDLLHPDAARQCNLKISES